MGRRRIWAVGAVLMVSATALGGWASGAAAAVEAAPVVQLEPGLDARCVAKIEVGSAVLSAEVRRRGVAIARKWAAAGPRT